MHHQEPPWEALPSLALANIFCRTSIKDRSRSIPFVCKSWAHAARHPHCWASMIAETGNSSAAHAFVMDYEVNFVDPYDGLRSPCPYTGVANLEALIGRAGGGALVTCIYFFPFLTPVDGPANDDAILGLIARQCPNLKHISFHGSYKASNEAMLEIIHSCRNLELVDFSDSPYFNPFVLELISCCPNVRGIRKNGYLEPSFSNLLSAGIGSLTMLNISNSTVGDKDLLTIVTGLKDLSYLDIRGCHCLVYYMHIIKVASKNIAKILYD